MLCSNVFAFSKWQSFVSFLKRLFFISFWIIFICHAFKYVKKEDKVINISKRKIRIREDLSHQRKERYTYELLMTKKICSEMKGTSDTQQRSLKW